MKRRRQVRGITLPHRPRRRAGSGTAPSICLTCGEAIDRDAVVIAIDRGVRYVHPCGRVLNRGGDDDASVQS